MLQVIGENNRYLNDRLNRVYSQVSTINFIVNSVASNVRSA